MDTSILRSEIEADPTGLGLGALLAEGRDSAIADALNDPGHGAAVPAAVNPEALLPLMRPGDMPKPDTAERTYLDALLAPRRGEIVLTSTVLDNLAAVFGAGSDTMTAIALVAFRAGSRAEELFGARARVNPDDVSACYAAERETEYKAAQAPLDAVKADLDAAVAELVVASRGGDDARRQAAVAAVDAARSVVTAEFVKAGANFEDTAGPFVLPAPEEIP